MAWRCGEVNGYYPGEDGYEEAIERRDRKEYERDYLSSDRWAEEQKWEYIVQFNIECRSLPNHPQNICIRAPFDIHNNYRVKKFIEYFGNHRYYRISLNSRYMIAMAPYGNKTCHEFFCPCPSELTSSKGVIFITNEEEFEETWYDHPNVVVVEAKEC